MQSSTIILERFRQNYIKDIDLTLRPAYHQLLTKLGSPHRHLPPVFHVAGTNGKGSTCAFLRSILEASGYRVHVYTSPHLVSFHERIRVAGSLIEEEELTSILTECECESRPSTLSYFEVATAAAFVAFARHPADFTIIEVGLGGRLDATNVVPAPLANIITRLSYDHREYLGETLSEIAREKAGIMQPDVPCFVAPQPSDEAISALQEAARIKKSPLYIGDKDWSIAVTTRGFRFRDATRDYDLPPPGLLGYHQFNNAALAIAALSVLPNSPPQTFVAEGVQRVKWPARLQHLSHGALAAILPKGWDLWLDGGHNDSAGEVLAQQAKTWDEADSRPLYLILGMLTTKRPGEFISPLVPLASRVDTVNIPDEPLSFTSRDLALHMRTSGISNTHVADSLKHALNDIIFSEKPGRILICGSLYLAGHALRENLHHLPPP